MVYGQVFMTKILIPKMLKNDKRSGIINVGSIGARRPIHSNSVYTGTKSFISQFSQCLDLDYQNKLHRISYINIWFNYILTHFYFSCRYIDCKYWPN